MSYYPNGRQSRSRSPSSRYSAGSRGGQHGRGPSPVNSLFSFIRKPESDVRNVSQAQHRGPIPPLIAQMEASNDDYDEVSGNSQPPLPPLPPGSPPGQAPVKSYELPSFIQTKWDDFDFRYNRPRSTTSGATSPSRSVHSQRGHTPPQRQASSPPPPPPPPNFPMSNRSISPASSYIGSTCDRIPVHTNMETNYGSRFPTERRIEAPIVIDRDRPNQFHQPDYNERSREVLSRSNSFDTSIRKSSAFQRDQDRLGHAPIPGLTDDVPVKKAPLPPAIDDEERFLYGDDDRKDTRSPESVGNQQATIADALRGVLSDDKLTDALANQGTYSDNFAPFNPPPQPQAGFIERMPDQGPPPMFTGGYNNPNLIPINPAAFGPRGGPGGGYGEPPMPFRHEFNRFPRSQSMGPRSRFPTRYPGPPPLMDDPMTAGSAVAVSSTTDFAEPPKPVRQPMTSYEFQKLKQQRAQEEKRKRDLNYDLRRLRSEHSRIYQNSRLNNKHQDPAIVENRGKQAQIEKQLNEVEASLSQVNVKLEEEERVRDDNDAFNLNSRVNARQSVKPGPQPRNSAPVQPKKIDKYKYDLYDGGDYWCRACNVSEQSLLAMLEHLQSYGHKKLMHPNDKPWQPESVKTGALKRMIDNPIRVAIKGAEFFMPCSAYYCKLCKMFIGDVNCAEDHAKSDEHYEAYLSYVQGDTAYEKRRTLDRSDIGLSGGDLKRKNDENEHQLQEKRRKQNEVEAKRRDMLAAEVAKSKQGVENVQISAVIKKADVKVKEGEKLEDKSASEKLKLDRKMEEKEKMKADIKKKMKETRDSQKQKDISKSGTSKAVQKGDGRATEKFSDNGKSGVRHTDHSSKDKPRSMDKVENLYIHRDAVKLQKRLKRRYFAENPKLSKIDKISLEGKNVYPVVKMVNFTKTDIKNWKSLDQNSSMGKGTNQTIVSDSVTTANSQEKEAVCEELISQDSVEKSSGPLAAGSEENTSASNKAAVQTKDAYGKSVHRETNPDSDGVIETMPDDVEKLDSGQSNVIQGISNKSALTDMNKESLQILDKISKESDHNITSPEDDKNDSVALVKKDNINFKIDDEDEEEKIELSNMADILSIIAEKDDDDDSSQMPDGLEKEADSEEVHIKSELDEVKNMVPKMEIKDGLSASESGQSSPEADVEEEDRKLSMIPIVVMEKMSEEEYQLHC